MTDPRTPVFELLRPHLRAGWHTDLIDQFNRALDQLGAARAPLDVKPRAPAELVEALTFAQRQVDVDLLAMAFPANNKAALTVWVEPIRRAIQRWGIDTFREVASFLANINVESAGLTRLVENLNYRADALVSIFGRHRISIADAQRYGRTADHRADQVALANILYGGEWGRKNLGNTEPGDGWKFRGQGPKQITGRANFTRFAEAIGMTLEDAVAYIATPEGGMMAAGWFWKSHGLDERAATPGLEDDRRAINGGVLGLAEVERIFAVLIDELLRREKAQ